MVNSKWSKEKAKKRVEYYLSSSMEVIMNSIEKDAPLDSKLFEEIARFKEKRNWLTQEFDQESALSLIQGKGFELYSKILDEIINNAKSIIERINKVDERLIRPRR